MPYATLTSKGYITILKAVRNNLNLKTSDVLDFKIENGKIKIVPVKNSIDKAYSFMYRKNKEKYLEKIKIKKAMQQ